MTPMSRFYADEPTREREVAMYVDGKYLARGSASEARSPASYGFKGWETIPPDRITFERDRGPFEYDRPYLCWCSGERPTATEILAWLRETA